MPVLHPNEPAYAAWIAKQGDFATDASGNHYYETGAFKPNPATELRRFDKHTCIDPPADEEQRLKRQIVYCNLKTKQHQQRSDRIVTEVSRQHSFYRGKGMDVPAPPYKQAEAELNQLREKVRNLKERKDEHEQRLAELPTAQRRKAVDQQNQQQQIEADQAFARIKGI